MVQIVVIKIADRIACMNVLVHELRSMFDISAVHFYIGIVRNHSSVAFGRRVS